MDWSGQIGSLIALASGVLILSLMFWGGQMVMNFLGDDTPASARPARNSEAELHNHHWLSGAHVRYGHERLATQLERDDVDRIAGEPESVRVRSSSRS